jgi:hypothetical protein
LIFWTVKLYNFPTLNLLQQPSGSIQQFAAGSQH